MDLKNLDAREACDKPTELQLKHPATGKPLDIFITILGRESAAIKDHEQGILNHRLRQQQTGKDQDTAESLEKRMVKLVTVATLGWRGIDMDGKPYEYSAKNAKKLYSNPGYAWIVSQVHAGIKDLELFMTA